MTVKKEAFKNIVRKGENTGYKRFLLFPQCFLPIPKGTSVVKLHLFCKSANALSLDQSKNLSFGKELGLLLMGLIAKS